MHVSCQTVSSSRIFSRRADEGDVLDHGQRDRRRGLVLAAGEVQLLDLGGDVLVAHAGEHLEVEVGAAGAHAAGVEGEERPHGVGAALGVVAGDDEHARGDLEAVGLAGLAARREALGEALAVEAVLLGGEEQRQPAVADLGGEGDVLRPLGGDEDRDVRCAAGGRST